jgi:hypothetical protein
MLIVLIQRGFDLVCWLAGITVLCILGPTMLFSGTVVTIPNAQALTRLDGRLLGCSETFSASLLVLDGRSTPLQSQAGSCAELQEDPAPHVAVFVLPADMSISNSSTAISSYGLSVDVNVVREPRSDIKAARIDRAFRLCLGSLGTISLVLLLFALISAREYLYEVLTAGTLR